MLGVATVLGAAALVDTVHAAVPSTNVFPIAHSGAACTNSYGDPRSGGRRHAGVDCFSPAGTGTPLVAVESGVIDRRYPHDPSNPCGRGNAVAIRGNSGTRYYYGHLNRIDVAMNQRVTRGQRIGTLGQTGNANPACGGGGPHLHFELRPDGTNTVDPYPYVTTWSKVGSGPADRYQPAGRFDVATARGGGRIGLYGWTFDRDTPTRPNLVHVYVQASNGRAHAARPHRQHQSARRRPGVSGGRERPRLGSRDRWAASRFDDDPGVRHRHVEPRERLHRARDPLGQRDLTTWRPAFGAAGPVRAWLSQPASITETVLSASLLA